MLTSLDVKRDTNLLVNTSLVKLRYQQIDLFNSDALTSAHKVHVHVVFELHVHVHHSLSCVPLQQYRACIVDSLGLGITCVLYVLCVQGTPILSLLLFMPSLYSTFYLKNITFTCMVLASANSTTTS